MFYHVYTYVHVHTHIVLLWIFYRMVLQNKVLSCYIHVLYIPGSTMYVHSFSLYKTCTCMTFPGTLVPGSNCGEIGQCCMCTFKLQYNMNNFYEPDFLKNWFPFYHMLVYLWNIPTINYTLEKCDTPGTCIWLKKTWLHVLCLQEQLLYFQLFICLILGIQHI